MAFISAAHSGFVAPRGAERLDDGAIHIPAGPEGCVLWGPHISAEAGVYRATTRTRAEDAEGGAPLYWDVYANGSVYGTAEFLEDSSLVVRLPDTEALEFRLTTRGAGLIHRGVQFESLLLDRQAATADELDRHIGDLISEDGWPDALFHLIGRLASIGEPARAAAWRARYVARADRSFAKLQAAWIELHTPGLTAFSPDLDFELSPEEIVRWVEGRPLDRLDVSPQNLRPLLGSDRAALLARGYQPDFVHATTNSRSYREPRRAWQAGPSSAADPEAPVPAMIEALRNVDLSFQAEIARGEGVMAYCPVSGRLLRSTHGFGHHVLGCPQTFYRFEGAEVFYLCTGDYHNSRAFLYMPAQNCYILIQEQILRWYPFEDVIREFAVKLVQHRYDVMTYLATPTVKLAAITGLNNIGHFFWNDLSGLQYMVENGYHKRIAEIVTVPIQFIDYKSLFPELETTPSYEIGRPHDLFGYLVRNRLTPVRFTDARISPALFQRIRHVAQTHSTAAGAAPPDAPRPLIWLNLREANKVWVDQAQGYANILNALHEEYGEASAVLQGMPDCAGLADTIRSLTHPDIALYDGMNLSIYDKLRFAGDVDAYVCVAGAGLAFTTWLADQHGVAHAEHGHLDHLAWWPYARPEAPRALAPPKSAVTQLGTGWYCNYEVDWRLLLDLLREALAARKADPLRPALVRASSGPRDEQQELE